MNKDLLLADMAKLFMTHPRLLHDSICLHDELYWDSLSQISMIVAIREHYKVAIHYFELIVCDTIGELFSLVEKKIQVANT